jgi:MFS transporter, ACS family, glucarate transporter
MTTAPAAVTTPPSTGTRLALLLLLVASAGYIGRTAITAVAPQLMSEFGLSLTEIGALSSAFLAGYTICQIPSGWLADRIDARKLFFVLAIGWTVLMLACAVVNGSTTHIVATLIVLRALFGIFAAPTYPASARAIAAAVPPQSQARANGLVLASIGIGSAVTPLLIAPISDHFSWRAALVIVAVMTGAAALIWRRFAPGPAPVIATRQTESPRVPVMLESKFGLRGRISPQRSPLQGRSFQMLCASYFLQGYVGYIFVFWSFLYLREVRHFSLMGAASSTALPMLATTFGIPFGGVLSDAAVKDFGPTWGRRLLPLVALTVAGISLLIAAYTSNSSVAVAALSICTVLVLSTEGPYWATVNQLAHERGGMAGGIMNFGSNLGGMISPVLTPWMAERIGWAPALGVGAVLSIIAGLLWLGVHVRNTQPESGL